MSESYSLPLALLDICCLQCAADKYFSLHNYRPFYTLCPNWSDSEIHISLLYNFVLDPLKLKVVSVPSVLWRCWLGGRKGFRPVKIWVVGFCRGYLSGRGADLHMGRPSWCHCHSVSLAPVIQIGFTFLVLPFWYQFTRVVPDKVQGAGKSL